MIPPSEIRQAIQQVLDDPAAAEALQQHLELATDIYTVELKGPPRRA